MGFIRLQCDADNRQLNLMSPELARELGDGGAYLIAGSSTEDFLPTGRLERLRVNRRPRALNKSGNGQELALPAGTQAFLKRA